ncbi:MAG: pseudouridine-5'-phosphate glycosidase [Candidatus Cloacimonetes bacterium]|nr:pseudouridine-5'-phosphate glycosidase [Candidatus Cloacimonadota bacterium]
MNPYLSISEEVSQAIREKKPVVALESTLIAHGIPFPQNLELAKNLRSKALKHQTVVAVTALIRGQIKVGLTDSELEEIATSPNIRKVSRKDFGLILTKGLTGATTVSGTMIAAQMAGIKVFATGGIGGVHRHGEDTFDISADLQELSRTPVIVISAGAKAILDLPKTLEYLETLGVPVVGYRTDHFPAFYSANSGLFIQKAESAREIAEIYKTNIRIGFTSGLLVANPIPEESEIPFSEMEVLIQTATREAKEKGITGQRLTPHILKRLTELSGGKTLLANLQLIENNLFVACEIAGEMSNGN